MKTSQKDIAINAEKLKNIRKTRRESQTRFWKRFGVTQSRGSRFEQGMAMPSPVKILLGLYMDGIVKEGDLLQARRTSTRILL